MEVWGVVALMVLGAMMGSFAACQVWRLYYYDKKELPGRSVCLKCGYRLRWYDNIPILSWLWLKGRCRKCGAKIGWMEITAEVGLAIVFGLMGVRFWQAPVADGVLNLVLMGIMLVILVVMTILALYDAKWGKLPTKLLYLVVALAVGYVVVAIYLVGQGRLVARLMSLAGGVGLLAGVYYCLYKISRERWVGAGDWWLALAISLVLGNWWLALWELLISNLIASIIMLPQAKRKKHIYFGPFLVIGFIIVFLAGKFLEGMILPNWIL